MVQKEVMKKTRTYGLIGLLLAILLVAMIYAYGNTQRISTSPQQTQVSPLGAETSMKTFTSYDELKDYLNQSSSSNLYGDYYGFTGHFFAVPEPAPYAPAEAAPASSSTTQAATNDYSTTNIQVAGVDEADIVKTDGQYLYVIGNDSQVVYILDASSQDPQDARVLSEINLNNSYLSGIYLSSDGSKLVVLGSNSISYGVYGEFSGLYPPSLVFPGWTTGTNFVYVYDVSNKADPVLSRNFTMSGDYVDSRMIGDYVYDVISQNAYLLNGTVLLPTVFTGQQAFNIEPTSIQYFNTSDPAYMYTTIVALNVQDSSQEATSTTILMGNAGSIYVSQSNIYLTDQISTGTSAQPDLAISPTPIVPSLFGKEPPSTESKFQIHL